jgi:thiamine biosynthesis lipoprotein
LIVSFIKRLFPIIIGIGLVACQPTAKIAEQTFIEFGTLIKVTLVLGDHQNAENIFDQIEARLHSQRRQWHAWEKSDLSEFNLALSSGEFVAVPDSVKDLVELSIGYSEKTNNLFNPALGDLVAAYGFHNPEFGNVNKIDAIRTDIPVMSDLQWHGQLIRSTNQNLALDFGGIAKGLALSRIANMLDSNGINNYLLNAGGDITSAGMRNGKPWKIGIQNPFAPGVVAGIKLESDNSLFTSGNYQRFYRKGGRIVHHIIDPRNGLPSINIASATVMSTDPVLADVAATTLMIDGIENHHNISKRLGIDHYLIIDKDKRVIVSRQLYDQLELYTPWPVNIIEPE